MNNQEAIKILGQYDVSNIHFYTTDGEEIPFTEWSDAIDMAISALKAQDLQPNLQQTCNLASNDCISRQDAIDAIADYLSKTTYTSAISHLNTGALILARVPSAQPEDCDTCKHGYFGDGKCDNCRVRFPSHYERRADEGN